MSAYKNSRMITLRKGNLMSLGSRAATTVCVERGAIWATCEGDPDDHVLGAGETLGIGGRGTTVISALQHAVFRVASPGRTESTWSQLCAGFASKWACVS
jgi:hypothetical protein